MIRWIMLHLCWAIEDIHDIFVENGNFYPSLRWEEDGCPLWDKEKGCMWDELEKLDEEAKNTK